MKNFILMLMVAAVCLFNLQNLSAATTSTAQKSFVISPPPIPWYIFQKGQADLKIGGNYVNVSTTNNNEDISISGGGLNLTTRYAFVDQLALDFMFNYMYIGGEMGGGDSIDVHFLSWNPNFEIQPFKFSNVNLILFGGYIWTLVPLTYYPANGYAVSATAAMDGIQIGAQLALKAADFSIAPFVLYQDLSGSVEVLGRTYDMPDMSITTFGLDITYIPFGITLSSLLQQFKQDSNVKVIYVALSHDFRWGGDSTADTK